MELSEQFSEALAELEDLAPGVITWDEEDYTAFVGSAISRKSLEAGGFQLEADFRFLIRRELLPEPGPQVKQRVTYLGRDYRIDSIEEVPGRAFVRFKCMDATG